MTIFEAIKSLPDKHKAVFAALTCEKMRYSITEFSEIEKDNLISLSNEIITVVYSFALGKFISQEDLNDLKNELELIAPDPTESSNDFAPYALHSCIALSESLEFIFTLDEKHVENCATAATDTIDMYVQMASEEEPPSMPELDSFIANSPFMIREVVRQRAIVNALSKIPNIDESSINKIRNLNGTDDIIDLQKL